MGEKELRHETLAVLADNALETGQVIGVLVASVPAVFAPVARVSPRHALRPATFLVVMATAAEHARFVAGLYLVAAVVAVGHPVARVHAR
ncbi:MAG: hypothetical protein AAFP26_10650, partial [Planctomycetota bacterium]